MDKELVGMFLLGIISFIENILDTPLGTAYNGPCVGTIKDEVEEACWSGCRYVITQGLLKGVEVDILSGGQGCTTDLTIAPGESLCQFDPMTVQIHHDLGVDAEMEILDVIITPLPA